MDSRLPMLVLAALLTWVRPSQAQSVPPGKVLPLRVQAGRCECVLPTAQSDDKYYLIVGCLAPDTGRHRVHVRTEASSLPVDVALEAATRDPQWTERSRTWRDRLERARRAMPLADELPAAPPPAARTFHLFVREHGFEKADGYVAVVGDLRAIGRHCQVYVDRACQADLQPTLDDTVRTFDEEIYPQTLPCLGRPLDVDRDGRFTLLFTPWLGKLADGKVAVSGFVRGSDFDRDGLLPYSNRCDMIYLNSDLTPGPHLRTVLAHEYTHAVCFCQHVLGRYLPDTPPHAEESWLDEALAHVVEDEHGHGWSNLDYRISAFLSAPERSPLVVPEYYSAGLWRDPGCRGATYLFLRWCADRFGPDLVRRLVQSNLSGITNLETETGERFPELFRQWSASLFLSHCGWGDEFAPLSRISLRQPLAGRLLAGPRPVEMRLADTQEIELTGTSSAYVLLHCPAGARTRLTITAEPKAVLQVSLVRLPPHTARLSLRAEPEATDTFHLVLTAHDADVTLREAAWERLRPQQNRSEDTSYRAEQAPGKGTQAWFGDPHLRAGSSRRSAVLRSPCHEDPTVWKVTATDAAGHHVAAWLLMP